MMKVLFSNPPWWDGWGLQFGVIPLRRAGYRAGSRWPHTGLTLSQPGIPMPRDGVPYPLFMAYAASYARAATGAEVVFRDSLARRESYAAYYRYVAQEEFDVILVESATPCWEHDREIIQTLHRVSPRSRIMVTGPVTIEKSPEILATCPVDTCIKGEYDKSCVTALRGARGVLEHDFMTEAEMNAAPHPLQDEATIRRYFDRNPRGGRFPHLQLWSSRGCPHKCIFCVWPATMTSSDPDGRGRRMVRFYHPDHLEPFIREMVGRYGFKSVYWDDDTFNLGDRHTLEICEMMKRIALPWSAMCRTDSISLPVWRAMKESGCYGVKLGFESGDQQVIDEIIHKRLDLAKAVEVVRHLKSIGMKVHGTFTIGLPGETKEQMMKTLRFADSLGLDSRQISGTALMDGTPLKRLLEGQEAGGKGGKAADGTLSDGTKRYDELISKLDR